jgi:hypothetical protein
MNDSEIYNFLCEYNDGMYLELYLRMKDKIIYKIEKKLQGGAYYEYDNLFVVTLTNEQYRYVGGFIKYIKQSDYCSIYDEDIQINDKYKTIELTFRDNKPSIYDNDDLTRILLILMEFFDNIQ